MAQRKQRRTRAVDGDIELEQAAERYRQLRSWKQQAEVEMKELQEKLGVRLTEYGVDALTVKNTPIARYTVYDKETLDGKALKASHPRIYGRFMKVTHVERVDVP